MKKAGVYVHVPFCVSKCPYCDFISFTPKGSDIGSYFNALVNEIEGADAGGYIIDTIFIGGGTPTYAPPFFIKKIFNALLHSRFDIAPDAEITVEANPGSLNRGTLDALLECGVNRLSIGLQSADDSLLKAIGRSHTAGDFYENYKNARTAGFKNINADIMFSLPGQTTDDVIKTCDILTELNPEHISAYALSLEDETPMGAAVLHNVLTLPDDKTDREMCHTIKNALTANGYGHYEISNYAKAGFECRHNIACWERNEYFGFGLGAHSYLNGRRFNNTTDFIKYVACIGNKKIITENERPIDDAEALEETMFLGLRMLRGVYITAGVERAFGAEINKTVSLGLTRITDGRLSLTDKGLDFANVVFGEFIGVIR